MGKQVQFDDAARAALRAGVEKLAGAVRVTLGPRGRNVVIEHAGHSPTITNEGLTIAQEVELADRFENLGARLVREAAARTGGQAGDGTTTATVLAHALVVRGLRAVAAGHNPVALRRGLERAVREAVAHVAEHARAVGGREDLARIATVSAGGDAALGALVAEAMDRVGRAGVVTVEEGRSLETSLEVVEGVRFEGGYLSPYFVTDPDGMEAALDRPLVLVADLKFTQARDMLPALEIAARHRRPLLVAAEDVEGEALATMVVNRLRGTVQSVAVRVPGLGERRRAMLEDLALLCGANLVAADLGREPEGVTEEDFGRARRVRVDHDSTTVIEGGGRPAAVRLRLQALERELAGASSEADAERLRERRARLAGGVAVIRAGGATETAMKERRARIEDALAATRAAVEEGVVVGGGLALLRARAALDRLGLTGDEAVGARIVAEALEEPAAQIASNAGMEGAVAVARARELPFATGLNALTLQFEDLREAGILDPAKVVRCALENAASVAQLVLTTDAVVVESDEEDAGPGAP
uniref:Chaperonin GroEL n=1 Tax=Eiseniibacteriota bacterium TaxID=2212470 RepID=A0A832I7P0_UNCEI